MEFKYCDALKELATDKRKIRTVLKLDELDKLIHEMFPVPHFTMKYELEQRVDFFENNWFKFCAESIEDLTDYTGIFFQAVTACKLKQLNPEITWSKENGFYIGFVLTLDYTDFDGHCSYMTLADFIFQNGCWRKTFYKGYNPQEKIDAQT